MRYGKEFTKNVHERLKQIIRHSKRESKRYSLQKYDKKAGRIVMDLKPFLKMMPMMRSILRMFWSSRMKKKKKNKKKTRKRKVGRGRRGNERK